MMTRSALNLGDFMVLMLSSTLASVRDRLKEDGFEDASDLVADLVEIAEDYLMRVPV